MDNGRFPTTEQGLEALISEPTGEPERRATTSRAATSRAASCRSTRGASPTTTRRRGSTTSTASTSGRFGADGAPGGEGVDADIGNWSDEQS